MNTKLWTCKDNTKIRIKDMDDQHILNCIQLLERNHVFIKSECSAPCFQGEMAQWQAEQDFDQLMESEVGDLYPIYDDLVEEATKRNLFSKKYNQKKNAIHAKLRATPGLLRVGTKTTRGKVSGTRQQRVLEMVKLFRPRSLLRRLKKD